VSSKEHTELTVSLERAETRAFLVIRDSLARPVHVFIDGNDVGPAPWEGFGPAGDHEVVLKGPAYASKPQKITLVAREQQSLDIETALTAGRLRVTATRPPGAEISIDGQKMGQGVWEGDLPSGPHQVVVEARGFVTYAAKVDVATGQTRSESVTLPVSGDAERERLAREAADESSRYEGLFGEVALNANVTTLSRPTPACQPGATCDEGFPAGGALVLRGGYNFGILGFELAGAVFGSTYEDTLKYTAPPAGTQVQPVEANFTHTESYRYASVGGFVGLGPRITSRGQTLRVTLGVDGGAYLRQYWLARTLTGDLTDTSAYSDSQIGPGALADLRILLGSTPGVRFTFGVMALLEMGSALTTAPQQRPAASSAASTAGAANLAVPGLDLASTTQLYVGPVLGIDFGH
jgi:hypothetical protein